MKERIRYQPGPPTREEEILGRAACLALEYGIRPIIQGEENFIQTKEHLKEGSLLCYFNHNSIVDPGLLTNLLIENLGEEIKECIAPGSYKHLDPERSILGPIKGWTMRGFAYKKRLKLYPAVQFYDTKSYSDELVRDVNIDFALRARDALRSPGGVVLIAPEGTRNQGNIQLLKAQEGIGLFLRGGKNVVTQPIALIDCGLPWSVIRRPEVVIGPIYSSKQVREVAEEKGLETTEDAMMVLLAQLLPKEYRGVYAQYC